VAHQPAKHVTHQPAKHVTHQPAKKEVVMRRQLWLCAVALVATAAFAGRAAAYDAVAVSDGGTLSGTVTLEGTAPAPGKIEVTKDPEVCGKEKPDPTLTVGPGNGIANVVVVVKASKGKKLEPAAKNPTVDQKTCEFHPHVLVFPAGSTIDVLNSDGILHNIHTESSVNAPTNQAQPKFKKTIQVKVDKPEWPIHVKCDVHGWMSGYWVSQDHPYFALTDEKGAFSIADLPPGDYEVELWQEKLGKKTEKASIKAKETTTVSWKMAAK
jgi:plastocyanin